VDVRWGTAARTHERFNEGILAVGVLAGRQETVDVADEGDGAALLGDSDNGLHSIGLLPILRATRAPSAAERHAYLHARTMHLCVLDHDGNTVFDRNLACRPEVFLHAGAPFRDGLVVGAECMFAWYWPALRGASPSF
jgi:hypothetical protein